MYNCCVIHRGVSEASALTVEDTPMHGRADRAPATDALVEETPDAAAAVQCTPAAQTAAADTAAEQEEQAKPQAVPGTTRRTRAQATTEAPVPGTARRTRGSAKPAPADAPQLAADAAERGAVVDSDADDNVQIVLSDAEDAGEQPGPEEDLKELTAEASAKAAKGLPPPASRTLQRGATSPQPEDTAAAPEPAASPPQATPPVPTSAAPPDAPGTGGKQAPAAQEPAVAAVQAAAGKQAGGPSRRSTRVSMRAAAAPPPQPEPAAHEQLAGPSSERSDKDIVSAAAEEESAAGADAQKPAEGDDEDDDVFEEARDEVFETPSSHGAFEMPSSGPATSFATARQQPTAYKTGLERLPNSAHPFPISSYMQPLELHLVPRMTRLLWNSQPYQSIGYIVNLAPIRSSLTAVSFVSKTVHRTARIIAVPLLIVSLAAS